MALPTIERKQEAIGRYGVCTFHARWVVGGYDELNGYKLLDLLDKTGRVNNTFFAVDGIEYNSSSSGTMDIWFDSMPPDVGGVVMSIPPDTQSGNIDYANLPNGCVPDPIRSMNKDGAVAGNLVLTTRDTQIGDEVFIRIRYHEKGDTRGK